MGRKSREFAEEMVEAVDELEHFVSSDGFIEPRDAAELLDSKRRLYEKARVRRPGFFSRLTRDGRRLVDVSDRFVKIYVSFIDACHAHNSEMASKRAAAISSQINPICGCVLDMQQLSAIAMDVSSRLVLAGAGTGKTTTVVGYVKHLLTRGEDPDGILLLSYTNAATDELRSRVMSETGRSVDCRTIHSLAMSIVRRCEGYAPVMTALSIHDFVRDSLEILLRDHHYSEMFNAYMIRYSGGEDEGVDDIAETFRSENPFITLRGEEVKSNGEAVIANYLFMNCVDYVYEYPYPVDVSSEDHGIYRPDFHIRGTSVYIEYFGTDREGNVSKALTSKDPDASAKYNDAIRWKRGIHSANGTVMIELFSYDLFEGTLLRKLEEGLVVNGVQMRPRDMSSELRNPQTGRSSLRMELMISDISSAISILKENGGDHQQVFPAGKGAKRCQRLSSFSEIVLPVFRLYQERLSSDGSIDFGDLVNLAVEHVESGRYVHTFTHVVIDEYQDMSLSRYRLLKALRDSKDFKLFCVGDDWQSIYRFNGSDVGYMLDFERYWGSAEICSIGRSYRFGGELLRRSSDFISINPEQIRKELVGCAVDTKLELLSALDLRRCAVAMKARLLGFPAGARVLFLGRYRHDVTRLDGEFSWAPKAGEQYIEVTCGDRADLDMRFMTMHGSKGLQADYVFILNNVKGPYGFPSTRAECPVVSAMTTYPNDDLQEERRLMYVALTRARKAAYIVTVQGSESVFVRDLFDVMSQNPMMCPLCGALLVLRSGPHGMFYGCSNYWTKGCRYTQDEAEMHR